MPRRSNLLILAALLVSGCASFSYPVHALPVGNGPDAHYLREVPAVAQSAYQCGPAALESVTRYWGEEADAQEIGRLLYKRGTRGVLNFTLAQYARERGFWAEMRPATADQLRFFLRKGIPPIVMLQVGPFGVPLYHFVVLKGFDDKDRIFYANVGKEETQAIPTAPFLKRWKRAHSWTLVISPLDRVDWPLPPEQAFGLAYLLERAGRLELAKARYEEVLKSTPKSESARFNLANVYLKMRRLKEAKVIYQELIREKPGFAPFSNNLAWIHLIEGKPKLALRVIEEAFQNGAPRYSDILHTAGLAYYRLRQFQKGYDYLKAAIREKGV